MRAKATADLKAQAELFLVEIAEQAGGDPDTVSRIVRERTDAAWYRILTGQAKAEDKDFLKLISYIPIHGQKQKQRTKSLQSIRQLYGR